MKHWKKLWWVFCRFKTLLKFSTSTLWRNKLAGNCISRNLPIGLPPLLIQKSRICDCSEPKKSWIKFLSQNNSSCRLKFQILSLVSFFKVVSPGECRVLTCVEYDEFEEKNEVLCHTSTAKNLDLWFEISKPFYICFFFEVVFFSRLPVGLQSSSASSRFYSIENLWSNRGSPLRLYTAKFVDSYFGFRNYLICEFLKGPFSKSFGFDWVNIFLIYTLPIAESLG